MRSQRFGIFNVSQSSFLTTQRASVNECSNVRVNVCVCASGRARIRIHAGVYNDTAKAAPHVSHYDFSALLLIKMQIYRGGGASERERSGGKTDYVWGRHDKHRNMINSTQPHPGTPTPPPSPRPPAVPLTPSFHLCPALTPLDLPYLLLLFVQLPRPDLSSPPRDLSDQFLQTTRTTFLCIYHSLFSSSLFPIDIEIRFPALQI